MCMVQVTNLALFLHAWCHGAGFTIRHDLSDYLSLCRATFHTLIVSMPQENLKQVFFSKFATARLKQIIIVNRFPYNCSLFTHPKFDSRILKTWLLVHFCMKACNNSAW